VIRFALLSLVLSSLALGGCWRDGSEISTVAWSDDDSAQAYVKLLFEESTREGDGFLGSSRRNYRHQVWTQNEDGSNRRALTSERVAQPGSTFYFMRDAGYVLIDVRESDRRSRFDQIWLSSGTSQTIAVNELPEGPVIPCQGFEVLPSPDGLTLAIIERTAPPVPRCVGGTVIVTFVDALTGAEGNSFEWGLDGMPASAWTASGQLQLWSFAGGEWRVDPTTGPHDLASAPTCSWPRTSSSNISEDGRVIVPGSPDAPVEITRSGADNCWAD